MIIVDEARYPYRGQMYCHMMSSYVNPLEALAELHQFADTLGLKREWFQNHPTHPHYDISPSKRALALRRGANEVSSREMVEVILRNIKIWETAV
jgi:hypothetical protein